MIRKHKFIYFIAFFLLIITTNAQNLDVKWGTETEIPNKNDVHKVFSGYNNSIYIIRKNDFQRFIPEYFIEKYDNASYGLQFEAEIKLPKYGKHDVRYEDIMFIGKKLYVFSTYYSNDENKNFCFASEINQSTGEAGALIKIDEILADKKGNTGYFTLRKSLDDSKLLIFHHDPFEKYANEKFNFQILDENMKSVEGASITLPYLDKKFEISNYTLNKEGTIFLLASIQKENQDVEPGKPWNRFVVLAYTPKSKDLKEYNVEIGEKYVTDITFRFNEPNNSLVVVGFYSDKGTGNIKGEFLVEIDTEWNKVIRTGTNEFSDVVLSNFLSENKVKKGKEPQNIIINEVLFTEDGGIIIGAEQSYITTRCSSDSKTGRTTCVDTYHDKSVLVSKVSKSGKFEWSSVVPKLQVSGRSLYGSYYLTRVKDQICVIYNDNPENINNQGDKELENFKIGKNGIVVLATVDSKGIVNRQVIMTEEEKSKTVLAPKTIIQLNNNEAILFACWGKKMRFGKMSIK